MPVAANLFYFTGKAGARRKKQRITVANTWTAADLANVTCGGVTLTATIGTTVTTTQVASVIAAMINAANKTAGILGDETRNAGGREFGQFRDIVATSSGSTVYLESAIPGRDFTVTVSETTASDGTLTLETADVAATGPTWFDNAANYSGGAVPTAADNRVIMMPGNVSITDALSSIPAGLEFVKPSDNTGSLGRPPINRDWEYLNAGTADYTYPEYRTRWAVADCGASDSVLHEIGTKGSALTPEGEVWLSLGTTATSGTRQVVVYAAPARDEDGNAKVNIIGGDNTNAAARDLNVTVWKGAVDIGADPTATQTVLLNLDLLDKEADVKVGSTVLCSSSIASSDIYGKLELLTADDETTAVWDLTVYENGELYLGKNADQFDNITNYGTVTVDDVILTIETAYAAKPGSSNDFTDALATSTFATTTIEAREDAKVIWKDRFERITHTTNIDLVNCRVEDVNWETIANRTITWSAI